MTVETKLPYDKDYIVQFSQDRNEPDWMKTLRLQALEQADSLDMPKPDKTKIDRWNFSRFNPNYAEGHAISSLNELPEELKALLDVENPPKTY